MLITKLSKFWEDLRTSLWFQPTLIITGAILLAVMLIELDERIDPRVYEGWPRVFGVSPEGARSMLSAVASSMMTVAGVSFSIMIVALSLAATQYTSRVLRTFLRDRANQAVLGILLGVFVYCLVVLQTVRGNPNEQFVPQLALIGALLLAFVAVGAVIFFIHHVATSIQVSDILAAIGTETADAVDHLFPEGLGESDEEADERQYTSLREQIWHPIPAMRTGYIQRVDSDALIQLAREHGRIVRMEYGIGEFVVEGTALVSVSAGEPPSAEIVDELNDTFVLGRHQTVEQDAGFGIRQIVDMALKALSPGVNDTTTAVMAVEYLTAILARLAGRRIESRYRVDGGELRVISDGPTFESLLGLSLDQIRQNAGGNVAVLKRLFRALGILERVTCVPRRRLALLAHAKAVLEVVRFPRPLTGATSRHRERNWLHNCRRGRLRCINSTELNDMAVQAPGQAEIESMVDVGGAAGASLIALCRNSYICGGRR